MGDGLAIGVGSGRDPMWTVGLPANKIILFLVLTILKG